MHTNEAVLKVLIKIIVAILGEYPEQTMWSLIAVIKSNTVNRSYRGQEILAKLRVHPFRVLLTCRAAAPGVVKR